MSGRQEKKARKIAAIANQSVAILSKKNNLSVRRLISKLPFYSKVLITIVLFLCVILFGNYIYKNYFSSTVRFKYINIIPHHNDSTSIDSFSLIVKGVLTQREKTNLHVRSFEASLYKKNGDLIPSQIENISYDTLLINGFNTSKVKLRHLKNFDIRGHTILGRREDTCFLFLKVAMNMYEFTSGSDYKIKMKIIDDNEMVHRLSVTLETPDSSIIDKKILPRYGLDSN